MKRTKLPAILSIAFSLNACGAIHQEPPEKPTVMVCMIDAESSECICGVKSPNKPTSNLKREPMLFCEKATAFPVKEWEKYKNYVDGLESYISRIRALKTK